MSESRELGVGVLGFGTIGTGVVRLILENADVMEARTGIVPRLRWIGDLDTETDRGVELGDVPLLPDATSRFADPDLDVVVELIGGLEPARSLVREALEAGKHVVTANKALLSTHGAELLALAAERGVSLRYEASVGGGIPILRSISEGFTANRFRSVYGIINGTANYILTSMDEGGGAFADVLAEAQRLGYAEADPTYDVDGIDTAHKLVLLIRLAFGVWIPLDELFTEGIRRIEPIDLRFAREAGSRIKLLAIAKQTPEGIEARVHPTMVPETHLLADVGGNFNAVWVEGDAVGPTLHVGQGAGMMPTASAVLGDVLDAARCPGAVARGRVEAPRASPAPIGDLTVPYYLRFSVVDAPGVLSQIAGVLGERGISIASVNQPEQRQGESVPVVFHTHEARELDMQSALETIEGFPFVVEPPHRIRIETALGEAR